MVGVVVFGGNGCVGGAFLEQLALLQRNEGTTLSNYGINVIVCVNRGSICWEGDNVEKHDNLPIHCVKVGRKQVMKSKRLRKVLRKEEIWIVVDFSGYHKQWLVDFIELMVEEKRVIQTYVYISTDSVYEVCCDNSDGDSDDYVKEGNDRRPMDKEMRKKLARRDSYGASKWRCEHVLKSLGKEHNFPFIILRLADVIGPRDRTDRFLAYQLSALACWNMKVAFGVPNAPLATQPFRVVYSIDVGKVVASLICGDLSCNASSWENQTYNLGTREIVCVETLARELLSIVPLHFDADKHVDTTIKLERMDAMQYFPSITRRPICIERAQRDLHWEPTSFTTIIEETCKYNLQHYNEDGFMESVTELVSDLKSNPHNPLHGIKAKQLKMFIRGARKKTN
eukprot:m.80506 g.80506  ORF g.80506 m.80506 type:complete len:397 (-) comp8623_c0_seq3:81-1271(-)